MLENPTDPNHLSNTELDALLHKEKKQSRRYRRMALITILAVLFLIWVGSMVRALDAGMGCPDWPTCFGQMVPPTSVSELPADYKEIYANRGYAEVDFDPFKTWVEYLNRLTGTTIGFLIFLTLLFAWPYRKKDKIVWKLSIAAFLLVGFNGWLGAVVVSSNLHPAIITTHMLMSLFLVGVLVLALTSSQRHLITIDSETITQIKPLLYIAIFITLIQVVLGTQVREQVDQIAALSTQYYQREGWIDQLGSIINIHITNAILVLGTNLFLALKTLKACQKPRVKLIAYGLMASVIITFMIGLILYKFNLPHLLQPMHLLMASITFSFQIFVLSSLYYSNKPSPYIVAQ
ncbi:heme A synthase [Thiomicrorhabdus sp. Milos-T2]|uniref:COX15/CtaA family protein n=1 Tax=Thiomicrorhabdus sp. Milos-T2 TaxID=90814 RepID=UPI00068A2C61|nr:COX15/CtaA family protein [Thiomicrorhabdus sp. Milos-T2]